MSDWEARLDFFLILLDSEEIQILYLRIKILIKCFNTEGSFLCVCNPGWTLSNTGTCVDVNECALGGHGCGAGETCLNLPGQATCISKFFEK